MIVEGKKVDAGSDGTSISDRIYKSIALPPPILSKVIFITAGKNMTMKGSVMGLVRKVRLM